MRYMHAVIQMSKTEFQFVQSTNGLRRQSCFLPFLSDFGTLSPIRVSDQRFASVHIIISSVAGPIRNHGLETAFCSGDAEAHEVSFAASLISTYLTPALDGLSQSQECGAAGTCDSPRGTLMPCITSSLSSLVPGDMTSLQIAPGLTRPPRPQITSALGRLPLSSARTLCSSLSESRLHA